MASFTGKRLVIFGCGYVGAALARAAMTNGARVTALTRNPASAIVLREVGIHTVVADLAGHAWHDEIPPAPELAVDCVSAGSRGAEGYRHSYLEGMDSIVSWARQRGAIGTFIYTSSTSVYPQGDGAVVTEGAAVTASSERVQVLIDTEKRAQSAAHGWRRWFILRLAGIYGPGRHHLLDQIRQGEVAGTGEPHLNLIHRDDIVGAIEACAVSHDTTANQIFNVADDGRARKSEIAGWLASKLGLPAPQFTGEPAGSRVRVTPDRIISNEKLKTTLGWGPRYPTFREGYGSLLSL